MRQKKKEVLALAVFPKRRASSSCGGLRVLKEHRGCGVGSTILDSLVSEGSSRERYCIPYNNLRYFYAAKGSEEIKPLQAPNFICNRFRGYRARGLDVILMMKKPTG